MFNNNYQFNQVDIKYKGTIMIKVSSESKWIGII
jgi:hypothetical protein